MRGPGSASLGSAVTALPWCCIAPAALSTAGVVTAGVGSSVASATPLFVAVSLAFLARALHLALIREQGRPWARAVAVVSALLVLGLWSVRLGTGWG